MNSTTIVKLAVLIDADNAPPGVAGALLDEVAKYGTAFARRAYGDWTGTTLRGWKDELLTRSIQPIQQFAYTQGKNATDSAMIIDAMDLLYTNRFDGFCLVSSDSDFTRLAARIRESGLVVYGFGERKTPKPFVAACDKFTYLENLIINDDLPPPPTPNATNTTTQAATTMTLPIHESRHSSKMVPTTPTRTAPVLDSSEHPRLHDPRLEKQLRSAIKSASDEEGWANLAAVGGLITKQHPDFDPRTWGYFKLGELVIATGMFEVDRRRPADGKAVVMYARDRRQKRTTSIG